MKVISWSRNNDPARAAAIGSQAVPLDELLATADVDLAARAAERHDTPHDRRRISLPA